MQTTGRQDRHHTSNHRLTEAITRLVADRKLRKANRLLQTVSVTTELTFAQKVDGIKKKIKAEPEFKTSIARESVPMISPNEVNEALARANRQASQNIDGFSKDLLTQAISHDSEIASLLGQYLHWILTEMHTQLFNNIVLLARGIAIPKSDGGIRPICTSSLFVKLLGSIALARDGSQPSHMQYAIGPSVGHQRIVHKVRNEVEGGKAVIRLDVKNAFGNLPRKVIEHQITSDDPTLKQFFRYVYGRKSMIAIFGEENKVEFIDMAEGVKQGDATSAMLFCKAIDRALHIINAALAETHLNASIYAYMDDVTICADPADVNQIVNIATAALAQIGLEVNAEKSRVFSPSLQTAFAIPQADPQEPFLLLGANLAVDASEKFQQAQIHKQISYFDLLSQLPLHPQIEMTMLKICGTPRITYLCSTNQPQVTSVIAKAFDEQMAKRASWILDPTGNTIVSHAQLHSKAGLGFPWYAGNVNDLYESSKRMALTDDPTVPRVSLTIDDTTTTAEAQIDAQWMFFEARQHLTPAQYTTALSIRLNTLTPRTQVANSKCNCGHVYSTQDEITIEHILKCDMATAFTHTHRHNLVRDAIVDVARAYGITVTKEPQAFAYSTDKQIRPDILCHTAPMCLVTDITLIHSQADLQSAEKLKTEKHSSACAKLNCVFIPFAMHTRGTLGPRAEDFIRQMAKVVIPSSSQSFIREVRHAVSVAAAAGRANSILSAVDRAMWRD